MPRILTIGIVTLCSLMSSMAVADTVPCEPAETHRWTESDLLSDSRFGYAVAIDSGVAIVGAPNAPSIGATVLGTGAAYIVSVTSESTEPLQTLHPDTSYSEVFGFSVAISQDTIVVGAPGGRTNGIRTGLVYVYERIDGQWERDAVLSMNDARLGDALGWSVAIHGETIVAGAHGRTTDATTTGAVAVFQKSNGLWEQVSELASPNTDSNGRFGDAVAVRHGAIAVGAYADSSDVFNGGSVYVYQLHGAECVLVQRLAPSNISPDSHFGRRLSMSDAVLAVTAPDYQDVNQYAGRVFIFEPAMGLQWSESFAYAPPVPPMTSPQLLQFGVDVVADADRVVVGAATGADDLARAFYVCRINGTWTPLGQFTTEIYSPNAYAPVALSDDIALVGDPSTNAESPQGHISVFSNIQEIGDCNANNIPDLCDIAAGAAIDCNANGAPDECDIAQHLSEDCNANGIPDSCETAGGAAEDCNANGVPDECDIARHVSMDCNEDGVPDECAGASGSAPDCNGNGIPDDCDIANQTSADCDGDGTPDECGVLTLFETQRLVPDDANPGQRLGAAVALSENLAVVGTASSDEAYIFEQTDNGWSQVARLSQPGTPSSFFGRAVATDGDTVVIGALGDDQYATNSGAAYVFERVDDEWVQRAKLKASDAATYDQFGTSVAVQGATIIVGAPGAYVTGGGVGAVYVFHNDAGVWVEDQKLASPIPPTGYAFGVSLAFDGQTAAIATRSGISSATDGAAYLFREEQDGWRLFAELPVSGHGGYASIRRHVAIDGDTLAVNTWLPDPDGGADIGHVFVFEQDSGVWVQTADLTEESMTVRSWFGNGLALNAGTIAVGVTYDSPVSAISANRPVRVYQKIDGAWSKVLKLDTADRSATNRFGGDIAISGEVVLTGATAASPPEAMGAAYLHDLSRVPTPGDLDGDRSIDFDDVAILIDVLLGLDIDAVHVARADVNCSGEVDARDLRYFIDALLGGV
ncbi:MAG TPA: hypothetical protein PK093_02900 [Phycisphaerae bacterium]|nr:hypothetical protein [Phycisphaerae bacterium]